MVTAVLLGAGQRGAGVYAAYALAHPKAFRIVAVAEPNEARRAALCVAHGIPPERAFADWRALLAQEKMADSALVCTQDRQHAEPTKAALEKGYHVLCEKPMSADAAACVAMGEAARRYGKTITVGHVLRYSPLYTRVKEILDAGTLGQTVSIHHAESVGYWHMAHSYVRGNWRSSAESSPMILAKSCHDMDLLLYLAGKRCQKVSSFGSLFHFRKECAPPGAAPRCYDGCTRTEKCPFFAGKIYLEGEGWKRESFRSVLALDLTRASVERALREGPYGRCVYACDNDVVDHQVVNLLMEDGVTVSFSMSAFTQRETRVMNIMGTRGQLLCDLDRSTIEIADFLTDAHTVYQIDTGASGHAGSDERFIAGFLKTVETDGAYQLSSAEASVESHLVALAAERSRLTGATVDMADFYAEQIAALRL